MVAVELHVRARTPPLLRSYRRLIRFARELQLSLELEPRRVAPRTSAGRPGRGPDRTHPADEPLVRQLMYHHAELNRARFGGELETIPIRVSRRMKSRLGHYVWRGQASRDAEIVISRRHIRRNGWDEALHTLLHEMVHQWQDERGLTVDHGPEFRRKARAVGIAPRARRALA